jgi:hypothetical protein
VARDVLATMKEMFEVLGTVNDKASADAAKAKLDKLGNKLADLQQRSNALGPITKEEMERIQKKLEPEMNEMRDKMMQVLPRLAQNPEASKLMQEAMGKFAQVATPGIPQAPGQP